MVFFAKHNIFLGMVASFFIFTPSPSLASVSEVFITAAVPLPYYERS